MTGLGKMCIYIVHTSNFLTLMTHKIYLKWWIDVNLSGIVVLLFLYYPWKFHICIPFPVLFMILQMSKIGCVNYARFPKFGRIIIPNELVINWDHTGVNYKPVNNCTIATEGSKRITVTWLGDKRQLTAVLVASSTATNNIYWENTTLSSNYEIPRRLRYHFYSKPLSKLEDNRSYNEDFGSLHWDMQEKVVSSHKSCSYCHIWQAQRPMFI